ncbi:MAG: polysaccharide biosynthesis tyrosine autokinase [Phycisphaerae bacterium]
MTGDTDLAVHDGSTAPIAAPPSTGPTGGVTLALLMRCKWLMCGVFLLILGLGVPCIWVFTVPEYTATAVVRVRPVVSKILFETENNGMVPLYQSYMNTQVSIIKSSTVLDRVLDREDVRQTEWYEHPTRSWRLVGKPTTHLERLQMGLTIRPRKNTELIDVSMSAAVAHDAMVIVNAVVDEYDAYNMTTIGQADQQLRETLREKKRDLEAEIKGLIETKYATSEQLGTLSPEELRSSLTTQLSALKAEQARIKRERQLAQWDLDVFTRPPVEDDTAATTTDDAGAPALEATAADTALARQYAADPEWTRLHRQWEDAQLQLAVARQTYGEAHPHVKRLAATAVQVETLLRNHEARLVEQATAGRGGAATVANRALGAGTTGSLKVRASRIQRELELLDDTIAAQTIEVRKAGQTARNLATINEQLQHKRGVLEAVHNRLTALETEKNAPGRVSVASKAIEPSVPRRDRRIMLTILTVAAAVLLAVGAGYLRVSTDPKIRQADDVVRTMHVPFLGELPPLPTTKDVFADCAPVLMENIRMVRTALVERLAGLDGQVLLVTSSTSRTGKSSVSLLLGRSLANLGKRVLLVEADIRRPSLAERVNVDGHIGLAALLAGATDDASAITRVGAAGFDLIVAGDPPEQFTPELLANGAFASCLDRWRKNYDIILLDGPPLLPVADARILARHADGALMVLRSSHCRRADAVQALGDLSAAGGRLLGTVLVGVKGGGRSGAGTGYGYGGAYANYYARPYALSV